MTKREIYGKVLEKMIKKVRNLAIEHETSGKFPLSMSLIEEGLTFIYDNRDRMLSLLDNFKENDEAIKAKRHREELVYGEYVWVRYLTKNSEYIFSDNAKEEITFIAVGIASEAEDEFTRLLSMYTIPVSY